jgi:serine/threonine protein kinase
MVGDDHKKSQDIDSLWLDEDLEELLDEVAGSLQAPEGATDDSKEYIETRKGDKSRMMEIPKNRGKENVLEEDRAALSTIEDYGYKVGNPSYGKVSVVVRAYKSSTAEYKAIKYPCMDQFKNNPEITRQLFEAEARHLQEFDHPNIVKGQPMLPSGEEEFPFIELEFLPNLFLDVYEKDPTPQKAYAFMRQAVEAVCYLHSKGKVHNDIKSVQFMVDYNETVKLIDFGSIGNHGEMMPGKIEFTPGYIFPLTRTEGIICHDRVLDIYALGKTFAGVILRTTELEKDAINEAVRGGFSEDNFVELEKRKGLLEAIVEAKKKSDKTCVEALEKHLPPSTATIYFIDEIFMPCMDPRQGDWELTIDELRRRVIEFGECLKSDDLQQKKYSDAEVIKIDEGDMEEIDPNELSMEELVSLQVMPPPLKPKPPAPDVAVDPIEGPMPADYDAGAAGQETHTATVLDDDQIEEEIPSDEIMPPQYADDEFSIPEEDIPPLPEEQTATGLDDPTAEFGPGPDNTGPLCPYTPEELEALSEEAPPLLEEENTATGLDDPTAEFGPGPDITGPIRPDTEQERIRALIDDLPDEQPPYLEEENTATGLDDPTADSGSDDTGPIHQDTRDDLEALIDSIPVTTREEPAAKAQEEGQTNEFGPSDTGPIYPGADNGCVAQKETTPAPLENEEPEKKTTSWLDTTREDLGMPKDRKK